MIYFILTLFFVSLLSIIFMIWRKMILVRSGQYETHREFYFEIPYAREVKNFTIHNIKKYEHEGLVVVVKLTIQFSGFLKNKFRELKTKVKSIHIKNHSTGELIQRVESSKLLKVVSSYRHKISEITHKIEKEKKEENNL